MSALQQWCLPQKQNLLKYHSFSQSHAFLQVDANVQKQMSTGISTD